MMLQGMWNMLQNIDNPQNAAGLYLGSFDRMTDSLTPATVLLCELNHSTCVLRFL